MFYFKKHKSVLTGVLKEGSQYSLYLSTLFRHDIIAYNRVNIKSKLLRLLVYCVLYETVSLK